MTHYVFDQREGVGEVRWPSQISANRRGWTIEGEGDLAAKLCDA